MRVSIAHCTNSSPALTRIIETIQLAEGRIEASRQPRLLLRGAQGAPNLRVVRPSPSSDVSPRGGADLQRGTVRQGAEACEPVRDLARERHRWHAEPGYGGGRLQRGGLLGPRVRTSRRQLHAALHCISLSPLASPVVPCFSGTTKSFPWPPFALVNLAPGQLWVAVPRTARTSSRP